METIEFKEDDLPVGSFNDLAEIERTDTPTSACILPDCDISTIEDELKQKPQSSGAVKRIMRQSSQNTKLDQGQANKSSSDINDHKKEHEDAVEDSADFKEEKVEETEENGDSTDQIEEECDTRAEPKNSSKGASNDGDDCDLTKKKEDDCQVNNMNENPDKREASTTVTYEETTLLSSNHSSVYEARQEELEEEENAEWRNRAKHVFVLSQAGKPIYSRYGDEHRLSTLMGVMQALVSFVADSGDIMKAIVAGDHKFVFLVREHLILVCVSRTWEETNHLLLLLNYVYQQIISVLTYGTLCRQFTRHRNLDLRRLLNGTERFLDGIIDLMETESGILLGAVRCLPLSPTTREGVVQAIVQGVKPRDLVFAILLADNQLVSIVRMKRNYPHPLDLHLLINIVRSSESFRNAQSWSPICLPKFDSDGFLYAYISYLDDTSCLLLLTVGNNEFYSLHECRERIFERMTKSGCLQAISEACVATGYTVNSTGISDIRHFLYKSKATAQYTNPRLGPPYLDIPGEEKRILHHYYRLHQLIHKPSRPMKLVFQATGTETFLGWNTENFEMYATFSPLATKSVVISAVNKLMKWVQNEKDRLFILTSPTF